MTAAARLLERRPRTPPPPLTTTTTAVAAVKSPQLQKANAAGDGDFHKKRAPLFEYPPLPPLEIGYYCLVTAIALFYAWWCVWSASTRWSFRIGHIARIVDLPIFGRRFKVCRRRLQTFSCIYLRVRFKDEFDWEWRRWSPLALYAQLPHLALSSLVFNLCASTLSERKFALVYVCISAWSSVQVYTLKLLIISLAQGLFIFACTHVYR